MNFPADWQNKPLGSVILDIGDGGTPNTNKSDYFGGPVPWVVIQDIKKHIISTKTTLTELGLNSCSAKLWPVGAVIISTGATIGEVGIAEVPLATKQGIHGIVCSDELSSEFLYYKLSTLRDFLRANGQGSTIREVRAPFIRTIPIAYPTDKTEQTKIAEVLSTVDRAIEQTEALIAKQQRIKTGLMQDLLTKGIDAHGNIRSEATHAFKDSPLGRIPVEWGISTLDNQCVRVTDGTHQQVKTTEDGVPFLYVSCIRDGIILWDRTANIDLQTYEIISQGREPKPGVVLYTVVGSYGFASLIETDEKFSFQRHIAYILPNQERINSKFLMEWLNSERIKVYADNVALGNAQKTITLQMLRKFPLLIPSKDEQLKIVECLSKTNISINQYRMGLDKLRSIKSGLMHDLLTGKRRVTPLLAAETSQPDV